MNLKFVTLEEFELRPEDPAVLHGRDGSLSAGIAHIPRYRSRAAAVRSSRKRGESGRDLRAGR